MKKLDFFLHAMYAEEFRRTDWVISAFAIVQEAPDAWKNNPYPYRIVQLPTGTFYVDPEKDCQDISPIEGTVPGEPPFRPRDSIRLPVGYVKNMTQETETSYGNLLINFILLIYPFGNKISYKTGTMAVNKIEDEIAPRMRDTPAPGEPRDPKYIYVDEYLKFADAAFYLVGFSQLVVPADTPKSMLTHPDIPALKAKLYEQYKDQLKDQSVIAKIGEELQALDREWLKGDPSEGFFNAKSMKVVRPKLFHQMGSESGLSDSIEANPIKNSLFEGWDIHKFPDMNNNLRAGSFNRGAETMLGGESVKWLLRAAGNINITEDDCGSNMGKLIENADTTKLIGFSLIDQNELPVKITEENAGSYMGQNIRLRTPMFCRLMKTDFCKTCAGDRLSAIPTGAASAISEIGSILMAMFMAAMHGKALMTKMWDYKDQLI